MSAKSSPDDDGGPEDLAPSVRAPDVDREIVERFRAGDRRAFDEIVRKYQEPLRALVWRYVKNADDAKDVSQRAFVRAFEKINDFRGESAFRTWLFRIAVNFALNHIRSGDRLEPLDLDDVTAFTNSLGTEKLVAAEVWKKVQAKLEQLPPKQRLVLELRLFHELSFKEVAAIVDSSEDSAKVNFHHAVKRMRALLPGVVRDG